MNKRLSSCFHIHILTFIFTFDREPKNTYAKSNPGNSSTTAWKPLRATEFFEECLYISVALNGFQAVVEEFPGLLFA